MVVCQSLPRKSPNSSSIKFPKSQVPGTCIKNKFDAVQCLYSCPWWFYRWCQSEYHRLVHSQIQPVPLCWTLHRNTFFTALDLACSLQLLLNFSAGVYDAQPDSNHYQPILSGLISSLMQELVGGDFPKLIGVINFQMVCNDTFTHTGAYTM